MTSTFIQTIESDIEAAWGTFEGKIETAATNVWDDFKGIFTALLPDEYTIVKTAITAVLQGAQDMSIEEVETALLNAGGAELALVEKLGSATVQALIGVVNAATTTSTTTTA